MSIDIEQDIGFVGPDDRWHWVTPGVRIMAKTGDESPRSFLGTLKGVQEWKDQGGTNASTTFVTGDVILGANLLRESPYVLFVRRADFERDYDLVVAEQDLNPVGYTSLTFRVWTGPCGHIWDRRVDDTTDCPRCALEARVAERDALFDLQWKRSREADKVWQRAHPDAVTHDVDTGEPIPVWPDLGELLTWLLEGHWLITRWMAATRDGQDVPGLTEAPSTLVTDTTGWLVGRMSDENAPVGQVSEARFARLVEREPTRETGQGA